MRCRAILRRFSERAVKIKKPLDFIWLDQGAFCLFYFLGGGGVKFLIV